MAKIGWNVDLKLNPNMFTGVSVEAEYFKKLVLDSARYQWLRQQPSDVWSAFFNGNLSIGSADDLDAAIDQILKEAA